jgi:hypothetical protein
MSGTEIAEFNQFEHDLQEYRDRYVGIVYDLTIPDQNKQARSDRLEIGKKIAELDKVHAAVKAPLKAKVDLLDGERKRIKDSLLVIQGGIKQQITEYETELADREAALIARVDAIRAFAEFDSIPEPDEIGARIDALERIEIDETFGDHEANAALAARKTGKLLADMLADAHKRIAEEMKAKEKELAARKKREAKIRADAVKREKELAAREKKELQEALARQEKKAEQDRINAEKARVAELAQARKQAEQDRKREAKKAADAKRKAVAAEKEKAAKAERARKAAIEKEKREAAAREADKKHRAAINNAAVDALASVIVGDRAPQNARDVVIAIAKGKIPNVTIKY